MRRTLLTSVAALALAAASTVAFAQTSKPSGGAAGGAPTNAPAASPSGAAPAGGSSSTVNPTGDAQSTINETTPPGAQDTHKGVQKGAQDTTGPQKQKSSQQAPTQGKSQAQQSQGEQPRGERREQTQGEQPRGDRQQQTQSPQTGGAKQGAAERPMTSKSVSLTTEQKTTIRQKVLTANAPRVTKVDFDIKIGVAVPRTVRVVPLPVTIIEIEPEWRGYMYFVSGDQIIVVEPGTLRIVAVLDV
jgi:Protein of unknown function (DUF1236)